MAIDKQLYEHNHYSVYIYMYWQRCSYILDYTLERWQQVNYIASNSHWIAS